MPRVVSRIFAQPFLDAENARKTYTAIRSGRTGRVQKTRNANTGRRAWSIGENFDFFPPFDLKEKQKTFYFFFRSFLFSFSVFYTHADKACARRVCLLLHACCRPAGMECVSAVRSRQYIFFSRRSVLVPDTNAARAGRVASAKKSASAKAVTGGVGDGAIAPPRSQNFNVYFFQHFLINLFFRRNVYFIKNIVAPTPRGRHLCPP